jgi:hypothetical protein
MMARRRPGSGPISERARRHRRVLRERAAFALTWANAHADSAAVYSAWARELMEVYE